MDTHMTIIQPGASAAETMRKLNQANKHGNDVATEMAKLATEGMLSDIHRRESGEGGDITT